MCQNSTDDLCLAFERGREQWPDRTVDQAADKGFIFGWAAFAFEEASRDLAGGECLFLVIHRQGKEILSWARAVCRNSGTEYCCFAEADHNGAIGLTCNFACLHDKRRAVPVQFFPENLEHWFYVSFIIIMPVGTGSRITGAGDFQRSSGKSKRWFWGYGDRRSVRILIVWAPLTSRPGPGFGS